MTGQDPATHPEGAPAPPDRIFTIPNVLSLVRLLCLPIFLWLLFGRDDRLAAALLLAGLGATDWVDGYIARRFDQVSALGKILDPTADRLLLAGGVVAILIDGSVPAAIAWLTIVREVGVGIAAIVLAALGARRIDVQWVGKAGTFGLMFAFPFFLGSHADTALDEVFGVLAWLCVIPGLALSYYAAAMYVPLGRQALREGRAAQ